ncbi:hypothetical protein [Microbacterium azadirachtae]|uniref:hypothetical protein n=1 Tax=Microbacterium azadirachtae TaxID=582680 RepID=UPI000889B842|nr:hypothetical protein [Microbacterium azadirachtae]SDL90534.1 hypothetical protein SAMN04488593_2116 [Microbacterium azadirachtae]SEG17134.1 hypothetical protein SAMN04488594_2063 [Microbacterium azadirachtae]SEG19662.1 hypothetical protein SAMN04488592_2073 [Microbacterium azadirachtae]
MSGSINAVRRQDHDDSKPPATELVDRLRSLIGARLVAFVAGADATTTVSAWAAGAMAPPRDAVIRLRTAYRAVSIVIDGAGAGMVSPWLQGMNPLLGDRSPARALRDAETDQEREQVVRAAAAFSQI